MFKVKGNGLTDYFVDVKMSINLRKGISKLYFVCTVKWVKDQGAWHFKIFLSKQLSLKLKVS